VALPPGPTADHGQGAVQRGGLCLTTHRDGDLGHRLFALHRGVLQSGQKGEEAKSNV
jgi:hypothetical protein